MYRCYNELGSCMNLTEMKETKDRQLSLHFRHTTLKTVLVINYAKNLKLKNDLVLSPIYIDLNKPHEINFNDKMAVLISLTRLQEYTQLVSKPGNGQ